MFNLRDDFDITNQAFEEDRRRKGYGDTEYGYRYYFDDVVKRVLERYRTVVTCRHCTPDIISGWRHGFTAAAVARYILAERVFLHSELFLGSNGFQDAAFRHLKESLLLVGRNWGAKYGYTPSVDEMKMPPEIVQGDINKRLKVIARNTHALFSYVFNQPIIKDADVISDDVEIKYVSAFTEEVNAEIEALMSRVFTKATEAVA